VASEVVQIFLVIHVVDLDSKVLTLLKVILNVKALNPDWVQVVHDDLCHTDFLPLLANLLVKDNHAIGSRECIQIW